MHFLRRCAPLASLCCSGVLYCRFVSSQRQSWRVEGGAMADEVPDTVITARPSADAPDGWDVDVGVRMSKL